MSSSPSSPSPEPYPSALQQYQETLQQNKSQNQVNNPFSREMDEILRSLTPATPLDGQNQLYALNNAHTFSNSMAGNSNPHPVYSSRSSHLSSQTMYTPSAPPTHQPVRPKAVSDVFISANQPSVVCAF